MKSYPLFKVHVDVEAAMTNMRSVLESGFLNEGVQVAQLTDALKQIIDHDNVVVTNSCTSALTLAIDIAKRKSKHVDNVLAITTPMTCIATNTPIVDCNIDMEWADIDPETGCIDVKSIGELLHKNAKRYESCIVMLVDWAGNPCDLSNIDEVKGYYGATTIQDAAHAFGATFKTKDISFWTDYTCFSFQAIKHVTTGDGGALVCNNSVDYELAKKLKWFGIDRDVAKDANGNWKGQHWDFDVPIAGNKFNMNNLSAALGLSQLPHVPRILEGHRSNAKKYNELLEGSQFIRPVKCYEGANSAYWVYTVLMNDRYIHIRDKLLEALNAEGIGAGLVHVPNDNYTCFKHIKKLLPGVRKFEASQFSLPVGWWLDHDDVKHIVNRVEIICKGLT